MARIGSMLAALAVIGLALASGTRAQDGVKWRGSGGWGAGLPYQRLFDPTTVIKQEGEVIRVEKITPQQGMSDGIRLVLRTRDETIPVHLGPEWFLERQDFSLAPGDRVTVSGSRVVFEGRPAMIASQVQKGDNVLTLREPSGFPLWSAWRRR